MDKYAAANQYIQLKTLLAALAGWSFGVSLERAEAWFVIRRTESR